MREENEKRWAALQKLTEEEVLHVREGQKVRGTKRKSGRNNNSVEISHFAVGMLWLLAFVMNYSDFTPFSLGGWIGVWDLYTVEVWHHFCRGHRHFPSNPPDNGPLVRTNSFTATLQMRAMMAGMPHASLFSNLANTWGRFVEKLWTNSPFCTQHFIIVIFFWFVCFHGPTS